MTRIPTRPLCERCRRYIGINSEVDDDLWIELFGATHGPGYICADCVARAADERLIDWTGKLRFVSLSLAAQVRLQRNDEGVSTPPTPNKDEAR